MLAMERAVLPCIFMLVVFHHFGVRVGVTQSPEASFNDPRCDGEMVCPNTPLLFTCNVTGSTSDVATVRLPSGQAVGITIMDMINVINGPLPDGVNTSSYNVEGSGPVNYSLTLSIERADILDGMDVICDARTLPPTTDEATCPVATDQPGPPVNPSQIVSGDTESSAVVQWQRPEETGGRGINISSYTVTVCNITGHQMSESVPDDDRENGTFTHTITGLTYNTTYTVKVTTINSCGLASQSSPINIIIEAEVPPQPTIKSITMDCRVPVKSGRPVFVNWMNGMEENNVVYPGEENVTVTLSPGDIDCQSVTDNSCNAIITEEIDYVISVKLTNDFGSSMPDTKLFNSALLTASDDNGDLEITVNTTLCSDLDMLSVSVQYGTLDGGNCVLDHNETKPLEMNLSPIDIPVASECYNVSIITNDGQLVASIAGNRTDPGPDPDPTVMTTDGSSGNAAIIAGGAAGGGILLIFIIVAVVVLVIFKVKRPDSKKGPSSPTAVELVDSGVTDQDPNTISRAPHPTTGELYTQVDLSNKKREAGQDPSTIEHQEAPGGELYAMPQKPEAKNEGLTYAQLDIHTSNKQAPPSQGSTYADIRYNN